MISFRTTCRLTAVVCLVLFGIFIAAPGAYIAGYGAPPDPGGAFLGNRVAPMFLGLAVLCWHLREHTERQVRTALGLTMIITFAGIAVTGVWAFIQGTASAAILAAAAGEIVIAIAFAQAILQRD